MPLLKTLMVVTSALLATVAVGWLAFHYAFVSEQFFRLVMF